MAGNWDIIVIGGGIVGCSAAYFASKSGQRVLLFERDTAGSAQSGRCLGFVRQQHRDMKELPIAMGALRIWQSLEERLGRTVGWSQGGSIMLANSEKQLEKQREWQSRAKERGLETKILTPAEVYKQMPLLKQDESIKGASFTETDGRAEPGLATRAIFDAAIEEGTEAIRGQLVSGIETAGGKVVGVRSKGELYQAPTVICAAGAGTSRLLRKLGVLLPQEIIRSSIARTSRTPRKFPICTSLPTTGLRQSTDGSIHLSVLGGEYDLRMDSLRYAKWYSALRKDNTDTIRVNYLSPLRQFMSGKTPPPMGDIAPTSDCVPPDSNRLNMAQSEVAKYLPALADLKITSSWAGYIDTLPDMLPAIGGVQNIDGLLVATGFNGHGFCLGPKVGEILATLAHGKTSDIDLTPLSLERFQKSGRAVRP